MNWINLLAWISSCIVHARACSGLTAVPLYGLIPHSTRGITIKSGEFFRPRNEEITILASMIERPANGISPELHFPMCYTNFCNRALKSLDPDVTICRRRRGYDQKCILVNISNHGYFACAVCIIILEIQSESIKIYCNFSPAVLRIASWNVFDRFANRMSERRSW